MRSPAWLALSSVLALSSAAGSARADLDFSRLQAATARLGAKSGLPAALLTSARGDVSLVLERTAAKAALPAGAVAINDGWFSLATSAQAARALTAPAGVTLHWSPERHLLVDRALTWSRTDSFRAQGGGSGQGVVIGIVDTGVDVFHPDLRRRDGTTRVKWWIDFTRPPAGFHPELEAAFGCVEDRSCAVFSAADIDRSMQNGISDDEPRDNVGHGTHVASLAAGNGLSNDPPLYAGVAPEADLVVARVAGGTQGISDSVVLKAVRFVFERAAEQGSPAVVNLSLGSDAGAHDGSSAIERALTSFVGPEQPGRAIVVAAGNSGGVYAAVNSAYPEPFGVHTEVHVPRESEARVPILTPASFAKTTTGRILLWISTLPGDALEVGLERGTGLVGAMARAGEVMEAKRDELDVLIMNGLDTAYGVTSRSCLVILDGSWPSGETFALRLAGHGNASMWLSGEGGLDPSVSVGPLFPRARKEGTINVPASAPELIAVGATLNRSDWRDWQGLLVSHPENGAIERAALDSTAYFSSAGPNANGAMKPDIVAPGVFLVGAMSSLVDPRGSGGGGMFSGETLCAGLGECLVVDDQHAVSSGTSMAAPLVSGAVALLFERQPSLTQAGVRALLQAGARPLEGVALIEQQASVGALDVEGAMSALAAVDNPVNAEPGERSWLGLAASFARPDPSVALQGYLELRDDAGKLADGFDARLLSLRVDGGAVVEPLARVAPGLHRFAVSAPAGSGGSELRLRVLYAERVIVERSVPIAVDPGALDGVALVRGGCSLQAPAGGFERNAALGLAALLVLTYRGRARSQRAVRRERCRAPRPR